MKTYLFLAFLAGFFGASCARTPWTIVLSQCAVVEGESFEYCVLGADDDLHDDIVINITRSYAVGTAEEVDQISLPAGFGEGDMECITVNAVNNGRLDDGNTITLSISHSEIADAEVEVFDDEIVTIGFTAEDYLATEGRNANVCVEILEAGAALGRSIPFRVSTAADDDDDEGDEIFEAFKGILLFPLRSEEGDTVCFDIDLVPNTVDDGDYRIFNINIEVDSINVVTSPASTQIHVFADEDCVPKFAGDTPRVDGNDITVEVSDCVFTGGFECTVELQGAGSEDCAQGGIVLSTGSNRPRTLTVTIPELGVTLVKIVRRDNDICDTHLVNGGIYSIGNDSVSVQFEGTGPTSDKADQVTEYQCIVTDDDGAREPESCTSPYTFDRPNTATGSFFLDILPIQPETGTQCRRRPTRRFTLIVPPVTVVTDVVPYGR